MLFIETMSSIVIDTHNVVRRFKEAGFNTKLAETVTGIFAELVENNLVTRNTFKRDLRELEYHLTIRLGSMMVAVIAVLVKLL